MSNPTVCCCFVIAPNKRDIIIEKYGEYNRTINNSCEFIVPCDIERPIYEVDMREIMVEVDKSSSILKDNVTVQVEGVAYIRVKDSYQVV